LLFFLRTAELSDPNLLVDQRIRDLLETYEGVRIFRDGLNVPPYGLGGMDWAGLEKLRTSTGGPTMVPGNSQLVGEVHLSRNRQAHLNVTAGRAGFTDQEALEKLGEYVRWAARCIGVMRRAARFEITSGQVPSRVDERKDAPGRTRVEEFRRLLRSMSPQTPPSADALHALVEGGNEILEAYERQQGIARIYAQLATTGASAASFAHELRKDFDIVSDAVAELVGQRSRLGPLAAPVRSLSEGWRTIRGFVRLFRLIPVKMRRRLQVLSAEGIRESLKALVQAIPHDGITVDTKVNVSKVKIVPAELDSIVLNLYTNAVKAIRENHRRSAGRVLIRVYTQASDLIVEVLDNGTGVSAAVARTMWEPAEGAFSEGTGMGLPISRFLARLYRGDVSHVDQPRAGFATLFRAQLRGVVA
jgi:signal transduction histidine kinase